MDLRELGWGVKCEVILYLLLHPLLPLPLAQTNKQTNKRALTTKSHRSETQEIEDGEETASSASITKQQSEAKVFVKHLYQRISACSSVL